MHLLLAEAVLGELTSAAVTLAVNVYYRAKTKVL
jgi:hypothetical protein